MNTTQLQKPLIKKTITINMNTHPVALANQIASPKVLMLNKRSNPPLPAHKHAIRPRRISQKSTLKCLYKLSGFE